MQIYLREMSDCLLQCEKYDDWMRAAQIVDHNEKLYALQVHNLLALRTTVSTHFYTCCPSST